MATIGDGKTFTSGRHLAAWLGLVPRQNSSGGKERLGAISKAGDGYVRRMLVHGARAVMRWWRTSSPWLAKLLERRPVSVAVVALANKTARIAWAVMTRGDGVQRRRWSWPDPDGADAQAPTARHSGNRQVGTQRWSRRSITEVGG